MTSGRVRNRFTTNVARPLLNEVELRENLSAAQSWLLLNCAVHATGDTELVGKYADRLAPATAAAALFSMQSEEDCPTNDSEERGELIDLLVQAYTKPSDDPLLAVGPEDVMQRMTCIAAGFSVPANQLQMNLNQGGFVPDNIREGTEPPQDLDIAIIGAGMSGLDAAVKALDRGFNITVYDLEDGPGGVWWSQRYPGVAVDTPATFYSLSFDVRTEWENYYPDGADYQRYLASIINKYDFADRMRYNSRVKSLTWLDNEQRWQIKIESTIDGSVRYESAAAVVSAAGLLNRAKWPALEGLHEFTGETIHTAEWKNVDLTGKRVAVVGNGAAGVQVIASLAPIVSELTVLQRQPTYVMPNGAGDGTVSDNERWLRANLPYYLQWTRLALLAQLNAASIEINKVDLDWMQKHDGLSVSPLSAQLREQALKYIDSTFGKGSDLATKLTPDFPFAAKRPVRDPKNIEPGGYFWAFLQPHVRLIAEAPARVQAEGIVAGSGELIEVDAIIYATGMTLDYLSTMTIQGRRDLMLTDIWGEDNPRTYLGGMVPGFPNFFVQDGPNSGVANGGGGHNFMAEVTNNYIFDALQYMVEQEGRAIEVDETAWLEHNDEIDEQLRGMLWNHVHHAHTYYTNSVGRAVLPGPFPPEELFERSQTIDESKLLIEQDARLATPS